MLHSIKKINLNKELIKFSLFNIADKVMIFLLPFFVLMLSNNVELYNQIEYVFSISAVLVVFIDFGLISEMFFGYKNVVEKKKFLFQRRSEFNLLIFIYGTIISLLILIGKLDWLYILILIKSVFIILNNFFNNYYRLNDKIIKSFLFSIPIHITSYLFILIYFLANNKVEIEIVFLNLFIGLGVYYLAIITKKNGDILKLFNTIVSTLRYSFPLIINFFFISVINHFGKIYSYNFLSDSHMYEISVIQRLSSILLLLHTSIYSYYAKSLFNSNNLQVHKSIFSSYVTTQLIFSILIFLSVYTVQYFIEIGISLFLLKIYLLGVLIRCCASYFEVYFNSHNKNSLIPFLTFSNFVVYFALFFSFGEISIQSIVYSFLFSSLFQLLFTIIILKKNNILFR
tara:strand:+ start:401 stop:1597 length:1197 start_codon:yes stop_codon:yes gene_type:complete